MKVILQESYMNLGEAGEIVDVKPGYARNFLLPQKLALTATAANLRRFEDKAKEITAKKERERENSKKTLSSLENVEIILKRRVSDDGKLFGSITTKELENEFSQRGVQIDRRQIVLGSPIKMKGDYSILVKLVGGMKANVPLKVISDAPPKEQDEVEEEVAPEQQATETN
jgi:large subunit ribosomal protein L9